MNICMFFLQVSPEQVRSWSSLQAHELLMTAVILLLSTVAGLVAVIMRLGQLAYRKNDQWVGLLIASRESQEALAVAIATGRNQIDIVSRQLEQLHSGLSAHTEKANPVLIDWNTYTDSSEASLRQIKKALHRLLEREGIDFDFGVD